MRLNTGFARLARWSLTLAALLMGAALLATVWTTEHGVVAASDVLLRGQLNVLAERMRGRLGRPDSDTSTTALAAMVTELSPEGLRWLAVLDEKGNVLRQAGRPVAPVSGAELLAQEIGTPMEIGGRVRVVFHAPAPPPGVTNPASALLGHPGPEPQAFEFEPVQARALRTAARRTFGLGALAAGSFLAIAVALVRWFLRRERREHQRAQERHLAGLGRMAAVMAHEIRNPLASLKGNAQLLARALPDGDKSRSRVDLLVDESTRLEALVSDLLDFARMGELVLTEVSPAEIADDAAAAVASERVEVVTGEAPARWLLDAGRIRQVLINLLENALQAGDGPVTLTVAGDGALTLAVRDHGEGLRDDDRSRLFEPFFTRRTRGTGLGLAVCKRLVELHGGTIAADNAPDGGACFTVRLPRGGA